MSCLLIASTLLLTLATTLYFYVKSSYTYWKRKGLPYLEPKFLIGNIYDAFVQNKSLAENVRDAYNASTDPVVGIYLGLKPAVIPRDPRIIQNMLVKESFAFSHRGISVNENIDKMTSNLFLQNGERWKEMRKILSPTFTSGRLKSMFETIVKTADSLLNYIDDYAESGKTLEISHVLGSYTNNVIASVSFGIDIDCIKDPNSEFRKYAGSIFVPNIRNGLRNVIAIMSERLTKLIGLRFCDKEVEDFMTNLVKETMEYRERNNIIRKDFFQMLIQVRNTGKVQEEGDWNIQSSLEQKMMTLDEMAAQAFVFYSAGYESSATTMTFCMYELAKNPVIQQKVFENIQHVLNEHDGKLTYESISEMKYLENCIEETLRMHAPFGFYTRKCIQDYKVPDSDVVIEKDTTVLLPIYGLHYDSQYFDQPEKFIPERHSDEATAGKTFVDMPLLAFGDGPRICIGMRLAKLQTKVGLCLLLQKYKFELDDIHKRQPLKFKTNTVVRTSTIGVNLKVSLR